LFGNTAPQEVSAESFYELQLSSKHKNKKHWKSSDYQCFVVV